MTNSVVVSQFIQHAFEDISKAINDINADLLPDIYALSFWKSDADDDPRQPVITVSYNTIGNLAANIDSASSPAEAKWNFAFWLQNELHSIDMTNPVYYDWMLQNAAYYSDDESFDDFERTIDLGKKLGEEFMEIIVSVSQKLHSDHVIIDKFGKTIPIIIHELEYYDMPLKWTIEGNPTYTVTEFYNWVTSM